MQAFEKILDLVPGAGDRAELRRLAAQYLAGDVEVLARLRERLEWGLRAARFPLPSRDELEKMLRNG